MGKQPLDFLKFAESDYNAVISLYNAHVNVNAIGFLTEQAIEKYLKHILCVAEGISEKNGYKISFTFEDNVGHSVKKILRRLYINDDIPT